MDPCRMLGSLAEFILIDSLLLFFFPLDVKQEERWWVSKMLLYVKK